MSSQGANKTPSSTQANLSEQSTDCALEAAKLLNCVASKKYCKEECITLLDSLRACIKKHVSFWQITTSQFFESLLIMRQDQIEFYITFSLQGVVDFTLLTEEDPKASS